LRLLRSIRKKTRRHANEHCKSWPSSGPSRGFSFHGPFRRRGHTSPSYRLPVRTRETASNPARDFHTTRPRLSSHAPVRPSVPSVHKRLRSSHHGLIRRCTAVAAIQCSFTVWHALSPDNDRTQRCARPRTLELASDAARLHSLE